MKDTWPIKANIPIPLFCLLKGAENAENADQFVQNTLNCFNNSEFIFKKHFEITEKAKNYLKELFYVIKKLAEYHISCNILRKDIIETESKGDDNKQTPIEVLFNRAATKGTPISKDDLNYAAIKSYWPTIKEENDRLSEQYMNPSKLVMLAFRLALTSENENSLKNELDINQIRALSKNNEKREKIETLYKSNLEKILTLIDKWLGVNDKDELRTPKILRTFIAYNSSDIYLLLMYLAQKNIENNIDIEISDIKALAFLTHWFGNDKKRCANTIFKYLKDGINKNNILKALSVLFNNNALINIYSPENIKRFIELNESKEWRPRFPGYANDFLTKHFICKKSQKKCSYMPHGNTLTPNSVDMILPNVIYLKTTIDHGITTILSQKIGLQDVKVNAYKNIVDTTKHG